MLTDQDLQRMKVAELRSLCERMQLGVPSARRKQPYIEALQAWQREHHAELQAQDELKVNIWHPVCAYVQRALQAQHLTSASDQLKRLPGWPACTVLAAFPVAADNCFHFAVLIADQQIPAQAVAECSSGLAEAAVHAARGQA
jgi:hypothetical protein